MLITRGLSCTKFEFRSQSDFMPSDKLHRTFCRPESTTGPAREESGSAMGLLYCHETHGRENTSVRHQTTHSPPTGTRTPARRPIMHQRRHDRTYGVPVYLASEQSARSTAPHRTPRRRHHTSLRASMQCAAPQARSSTNHVLHIRGELMRRLELGLWHELGHKVRRLRLVAHVPDIALARARTRCT